MANLGYVQVTRSCNQRCRICSNPTNDAVLSLAEGRRQVDQLAAEGYAGVLFTGGEPTLYEHLATLVAHATAAGLPPRIITNGQRLGTEPALLGELLDAGLQHVHLSLYSHRPEVVADLTGVPDSLANAHAALERLGARGVTADVNTVINRLNADHLDAHVADVVQRFPFVKHFVFNGLDTVMNRVADNPGTVPALWQFELSLHWALAQLQHTGRTFRVERVPLCYMAAFAHASTETRKIIKDEERSIHFLDDKGLVRQTGFLHHKAEACQVCPLDPVCAGLDGASHGMDPSELTPVFVPAATVVARVLGCRPSQVPDELLAAITRRQREVPLPEGR